LTALTSMFDPTELMQLLADLGVVAEVVVEVQPS
jgi:hypothetical protein